MNHRRKNSQRHGAVTVEFAITIPIVLLIVFASLELGFANMMYHTTEAAAYEAARAAIVPGATAQSATAKAQSILNTAGINSATIAISPADLSAPTQTVSVTISTRFSDNLPLTPFYVGTTPYVKTCELQRELLD